MQELQIGKTYLLTKKIWEKRYAENVERRMKLVGVYKHHAVFENEYGYCESFIYPDLKQVMNGIPVNKTWRRG